MKPTASISLDLDNLWSYLKTRGGDDWVSYPSYLDLLIPMVLDFLDFRDQRITFFIVGQDATLPANTAALKQLGKSGHEVGNHSFKHEPWLHRYTPEAVREELSSAHHAIAEATGIAPRGFRGPGFSVTSVVLNTLADLGYEYDASTFPTYIGPLARAYYFMSSNLSREQKEDRDELFGSVSDGLRPIRPYVWQLDARRLLEIPVTTMPGIKAPFHLSYVLYLSTYSPKLARTYFRTALQACRLAGVEPSLLLHPLDFLGGEEAPGLDFFPAMRVSGRLKRERVAEYLSDYQSLFDVVPMGEHARALRTRDDLLVRKPDFVV
ncbi:MAG TPA: polysaccharide deacetylase family protein [Polyangiaceae bacterium]|nr:polysaccharide deacetylase family protein [Polyangiaceae bacterium]